MSNYREFIITARKILPTFEPVVRQIPYEKHGVLYSEVLFMLTCLDGINTSRVLESGRARGQSTLLLAEVFPDKEIISVEFDASSPNVAIAEERLQGYRNVSLLFGDSFSLLPRLAKAGDFAFIDGPKMFLAVRLALSLLKDGKIAGVFIHDMDMGTAERKFLNTFFPEALFSDCRQFAEVASGLDGPAAPFLAAHKKLRGFEGEFGYGFAMAWLPYVPDHHYRWLIVCSYIFDALSQPQKIFSRLWRKIRSL